MIFHKGRSISLRRSILLAADLCWAALCMVLAAVIRLDPEEGMDYVARHLPSLLGSVFVFILVFYAGGMYERSALTRKGASYQLPLITVAIGLVVNIVIFYARYQLQIGRGILLLAALFIFLGAWIVRHFYRIAVGYGLLSKNTLIVGEGREVREVVHLISRTPDAGFRVLGIVSCGQSKAGDFVEAVPVVGTIEKLRELADAFSTETVIVATSLAREPSVLRLLRPLRCAGTEVMDYVALHEGLAQEIPLDHINDEWLMNAAMNSSVIHIRKVKRIMDVVTAVCGLIITAPLSLLAAVLVRMDSHGPVLYRQRRCGLDGLPYVLYKFRTMRQDAEAASGAVWASKVDARITRVGAFLRKWRVDEIPQLINVLRGEMSLVGPRPERPEFVATLEAAIPFYKERLMVPPGITGWSQVKYPYAASIDSARRKLQYDLYYIKHMSFFLDCLILLRTFRTIVVGLRHSDAEEHGEPRSASEVISILPPHKEPAPGAKSA